MRSHDGAPQTESTELGKSSIYRIYNLEGSSSVPGAQPRLELLSSLEVEWWEDRENNRAKLHRRDYGLGDSLTAVALDSKL